MIQTQMTLDNIVLSEKVPIAKDHTLNNYVNSHEMPRRDNSVGTERNGFLRTVGEGEGVIGW